jgi:hypothetical protein
MAIAYLDKPYLGYNLYITALGGNHSAMQRQCLDWLPRLYRRNN